MSLNELKKEKVNELRDIFNKTQFKNPLIKLLLEIILDICDNLIELDKRVQALEHKANN